MVSYVKTPGVNARALRDFGLALRSGPFRAALVLSLIVHLVLLIVIGWGRLGREDASERRIPLMRVRLLSPAPPVLVPAAPAIKPVVRQPRREQSGRPAAVVPPSAPASTLRAPEASETTKVPVATVEHLSGLASAPETTVHGESRERWASEETAPSPVAIAVPPAPAPIAAQIALAPEAGVSATGSASLLPVPARDGSGSGGSPAPDAATAGEGYQVTGTAAAAGNAGTAAAAETPSRQEPGPRDLAAVRHRIDAHKVYPQIAVRNGWEGRVLVEMRLEGDGSLTTVRLLKGSGYAVLDDATIVAVRRASPFPPIASVLTVPVEYRLVP